jgi:ABC-type spermidine/putrescine transport system permease subunit II
MRRRPSRSSRSINFLLTPSISYMFLFFLIPVFVLFIYSFWQTKNFEIVREFTWVNYTKVFTDGISLKLAFRSILTGLTISFITILISFPVAYGLTFNRKLKKFRDYFLFLILICLFSSYLIRVYAWRTILGDTGIINKALILIGFIDEPMGFLLYNRFAVIVSLVHILAPFAILPLFSSMQNINPELMDASRDLGASSVRTFFKVTVPLCKSGLISAFILTFILATGDYVIPALLGGRQGLMIGKVIADKFGILFDWNGGAALTFIVIILLFATILLVINSGKILMFFRNIFKRKPFAKTAAAAAGPAVSVPFQELEENFIKAEATAYPTGKKERLGDVWKEAGLPGAKRNIKKQNNFSKRFPFFQVHTVLFLIFMFLPPLIIILFSFNESRVPSLPFTGFSLKWYKDIFINPDFLDSLRNSLIVAGSTSVLAGILGTSSAFAFKRFDFRFKSIAHFLLVFPMSVPGLLLGISLLSFFVFTKINLSLFTVILGHLIFTIPFVFVNVSAALANFDVSIDEAARDLGAGTLRIFIKILFPIIKPAIIGGMLIAFALSFDEFIVTFFIIGGGQNTIPMVIFSMLRRGVSPTINAISSLLLITSFIMITIANKFTKIKVNL